MHLVVEYLRVSNILATVQSLNFVQLGVKLNQHFRKGGISRVILKMSCVNSVSKKNKIQILLVFLCHLNDFKGTLFFFIRMLFFRSSLNILVFLPILG